jgi:O-methyltransferase involved in polyketide biosynthesis
MFARMAHLHLLGKLVYAILDLGWPYSRSAAVVRTRAIDDLVRNAIRSGIRQLVLLGARLDSRGCRLDETDEPEKRSPRRRKISHTATSWGISG